MSIFCRVLIVVNLVAVMAYLFVYAVFFAFDDNFKQVLVIEKSLRLKAIQQWDRPIDETRDEIRIRREQIEVLKNQVRDLDHEVEVLTRDEENLAYLNAEVQHDVDQVQTEAEAIDRLRERMLRENRRIDSLIAAITQEINEVEALRERALLRANRLADEIEVLREKMGLMQTELRQVEEDTLAQKLILNIYADNNIYPRSYRYSGRLIAGQVLMVDEDNNTVIIDRGSEDHVQPGIILFVGRNGNYVGQIQITTVLEKISAGEALDPGLRRLPIQEGDEVFNPGGAGRAGVMP